MNADALHTTQVSDKIFEIALTLPEANLALTQRIRELDKALKPSRQAGSGRISEAFTGG